MTTQKNGNGIDLYTWATPNGRKVSIMLEELKLQYSVLPIDITKGEQYADEFLMISPNNKIPVIVDHENEIHLMESGTILMYLANKTGKLMSPIGENYWKEMEWLMLQMGSIGPMLGQTHHFVKFNPGKSPYAEERYRKENIRIYGVLEKRLKGRDYLCENYSIVDIATWPWISRYEFQDMNLTDYPRLKDWYLRIAERPAVIKGYAVPDPLPVPMPN